VIEFLCPNGHRIRCQDEQVGRAAKCPRCGVKFRVPDPSDTGVSEPVGSDSKVLPPEFTDSGISGRKLPASGGGEPREPLIEFLCPNGHRLHGPASLQGKSGQCPECGSRFRIPTYEDVSAEEKAESGIILGRIEGRGGSDVGVPAVADAAPNMPPRGNHVLSEEDAAPTTISSRVTPTQDMAALFARLWDLRPKDAPLKLRLRDGETIIPHEFLRKLSLQTRQGVFTMKDADGTTSLVVVAWDAVARVTIRGLKELPKELAE
jgi:DNA-directed RNA polymerase subunit RPC12/RpoP